MKVLACIPARFDSTRFAGKVLAKKTGKFLVQHTYEQVLCTKCVDRVLIATDSEKVKEACESFGAECAMTSAEHESGTDRIAEAVADIDTDIVINTQADEPEIEPANIDYLANLLIENPEFPMATLANGFQTQKQVYDSNIVKVVIGSSNQALYFSRSPVPFDRAAGGLGDVSLYLRHVGVYAYRKEFLMQITALPQTPLEKIEKLEQLRAIENGFQILVGKTEHSCEGIDTPQQYAQFVARYLSNSG